MAAPGPSNDALVVFARELQTLRRESGAGLEELGRQPDALAKSQLGVMFRAELKLPPDRDVVAAIVRYMLRRAAKAGRTVSGPATEEGWILRHDAMVQEWERARLAASAPGSPRTLSVPDTVSGKPGFVGRTAELRELDALLAQANAAGARSVVISALAGTAGVGKTALATQWASQVRDRFPDGVFILDLHGYHSKDRIEADEAVRRFLRALGFKRHEMPSGITARVQKLSETLRGRSLLIVWDNVQDSEHVAPLLLHQPTCFTLITSRDSLDDLVRDDAVIRIELDRLTLGQSLDLLCTHLRPTISITPAELVELASACVRLPLALRIAAETLNKFPARPVAELLAELKEHRLALSDAPRRPDRALRTVFSWSYRYLDDDETAMFRAVGLHPGTGLVDACSMAALRGVSTDTARRLLDQLCRSYLLEAGARRRYGMHDLLRTYAAELGEQHDNGRRRRTALDRLARYQLYSTASAMDVVALYEAKRRPKVPRPRGMEFLTFDDAESASQWLRDERSNLLASARLSISRRSSNFAATLSGLMFRFLDGQALYDEALHLHRHAVQVLRERGDDPQSLGLALRHLGMTMERIGRNEEAVEYLNESLRLVSTDNELTCYTLCSLGLVLYRIGKNREAIEILQRAASLAEQLGSQQLLGTALRNISFAYWRLGRYQDASESIGQATDIARNSGDETLFAYSLTNLGLAHWRAGRAAEALQCQDDALAVAAEAGAQAVRGYAMTNRGLIKWRQRRYAEALQDQESALELARNVEHQSLRAYVHMNLGLACWKTDDLPRALDLLTSAVADARRIGDQGVTTEASNSLGEVARDVGSLDVATCLHHEALEISLQTGDIAEQARAYEGLALSHRSRGRHDRGEIENFDLAIARYRELGDARAAQIAAVRDEDPDQRVG